MQQKVKVELVTAKQRVNLFDRFDTEEGEVEQHRCAASEDEGQRFHKFN